MGVGLDELQDAFERFGETEHFEFLPRCRRYNIVSAFIPVHKFLIFFFILNSYDFLNHIV